MVFFILESWKDVNNLRKCNLDNTLLRRLEKLGKDNINGMYSKGTDFDGYLFEEGSDGTPIDKVDFLS